MKKYVGRIYMVLIFLFMYAPIFLLMVFSFNSTKSRSVWGGFSLRWYKELFQDSEILHSIQVTLLVAVCGVFDYYGNGSRAGNLLYEKAAAQAGAGSQ